ncbi:twin-arginine translocase TatA/TatE family subunit [Herbiconiux moechotypicola]|uniref:Sec-independent protein translocase protein TatA n=1 Tax=Herbiconiux moechotypicola TaxID=637393 RepID=A0ABN3E246_9MICO|nr:twin-arginine translocase TatA/TatE family subunit [Herbiconiux moechotypicola]MCS5731367.1 twin-arginine translocase TatA/TatE family subunit [Herbiconiux moechotypicola]
MGFLQNLTGWHALILLAVVLLFFGAAKLPSLAKSLGQSARILKSEVSAPETANAEAASETAAESVAVTAAVPVAVPVAQKA